MSLEEASLGTRSIRSREASQNRSSRRSAGPSSRHSANGIIIIPISHLLLITPSVRNRSIISSHPTNWISCHEHWSLLFLDSSPGYACTAEPTPSLLSTLSLYLSLFLSFLRHFASTLADRLREPSATFRRTARKSKTEKKYYGCSVYSVTRSVLYQKELRYDTMLNTEFDFLPVSGNPFH